MATNSGTQVSQTQIVPPPATPLVITAIFFAVFILFVLYQLAQRYLKKEEWRDIFVTFVLPALMASVGGASYIFSGENAAIAVTIALISVFIPLQYVALARYNRRIIALFHQYTHLNQDAGRLHSLALGVLAREQGDLSGKLKGSKGVFELTFERKLTQTCQQIGGETVYVRYEEFPFLWKRLVEEFGDYASVCDLSIFSGVTYGDKDAQLIYEKTKRFWEKRVNTEIDELIRTKKNPNNFQKVIVYSPLSGYEGDAPSCVSSGKCDFAACTKKCIVHDVTDLWRSNVARFVSNGKSRFHLLRPSRKANDFVWLIDKTAASMMFKSLPLKPEVASADIGLFGDEFIGEEFKVPKGTGELEMQDYLYRFRRNPALVKDVHGVFADLARQENGAIRVT